MNVAPILVGWASCVFLGYRLRAFCEPSRRKLHVRRAQAASEIAFVRLGLERLGEDRMGVGMIGNADAEQLTLFAKTLLDRAVSQVSADPAREVALRVAAESLAPTTLITEHVDLLGRPL